MVTQAILARVKRQPCPAQFVIGPLSIKPEHGAIELDVYVDLSWEQTKTYEYSKLYFGEGFADNFSESEVICFRLSCNRKMHARAGRVARPDPRQELGGVPV